MNEKVGDGSENGSEQQAFFRSEQQVLAPEIGLHPKKNFDRILYLERRRTERSRRPFLLMLLHIQELLANQSQPGVIKSLDEALSCCIRETDVKGWYQPGKVVGIIFTELGNLDVVVQEKIFLKIQDHLCRALGWNAVQRIKVSYHFYPEAYQGHGKDLEWFNVLLCPELTQKIQSRRFSFFVKRALDFMGSLLGLMILCPLFFCIALAIKLTSKGPVFFRQQRVGQGGKQFTFLKFRSMLANCDESSHKEFVTKFIAEGNGNGNKKGNKGEQVIYKIENDQRITPLGKFLRKTSLDELPQFINVLKGEMSLVGPRPPILYECEKYDIWHRRRLLEVRPGITGLWQVEGRSKSAFNDMVRLDLKYINEWSLWLDAKILLRTLRVMMNGSGAY